jgi:hypothetical protein
MKPYKATSTGRIDLLVGLVMALGGSIAGQGRGAALDLNEILLSGPGVSA